MNKLVVQYVVDRFLSQFYYIYIIKGTRKYGDLTISLLNFIFHPVLYPVWLIERNS